MQMFYAKIATLRSTVLLLTCGMFCGLGHAVADTTETVADDRLDALERRLDALEAENATLRQRLGEVTAADAARPAPHSLLSSASKASRNLRVSGYAQIHAEFGGTPDARWNGTDDRIFIRRAIAALQGDLNNNMAFKLETELSSGSLGEKSGHTPRLTDAYLTWKVAEDFKLQVGQFKSPFGRAQLAANTKLPLVERPLVSDRLTVGRQVGVALNGAFSEDLPIDFTVGVFNGTGANASFTNNSNLMTAGRLVARPVRQENFGWEIAVNGFHYAPKTAGTDDRTGWGFDTALVTGPLLTEAEYLRSNYSGPNGTPDADGWWVATTWQAAKQWQGVVRYGTYDPAEGINNDDTRLWTVGLNYLLSGDDLKLSLNYVNGDSPSGQDDRILSRLQVKF
ncbi:porin [Actomonas aquatica]|uniref:Porin n=1 Tax=Actomonas aquatica TaxID=2866162 RepID=A0ABZ1C6B1_9BACT|nr:porin [Opitutus sp. WL0086]WRQ86942.1 porin [Opitutus sp. WL0086]